MGVASYRAVLAQRDARTVLLVGLVIRIPLWAAMIALTLHVVDGLGRSYSAAGLVTTLSTVALAAAGPWRGRQLDRIGLRRTVVPGLVVLAVVWSVAPFVGYAVLLPLVVVGGLANVPTFSIVRQAMIATVDGRHRQAALSLDALATEISFMVGPVLGVLAVTWVGSTWALLGSQLVSVVGGLVLVLADPPLVARPGSHITVVEPVAPAPYSAEAAAGEPGRTATTEVTTELATEVTTTAGEAVGSGAGWWSPAVVGVLAATAAATIVLTGTDLGVIAALRAMDSPGAIGWVLAVWGLGSALGALVYGAMHRPLPVFVLLALLAGTTVPVALADGELSLAVLLFVCGIFCAPTITATADALSRAVPATSLGEAMGWHGLALTAGSALGSPVAGFVIDHGGWEGAFVVTGGVALVGAALGWLLVVARGDRSAQAARTLES